MLISKLRSGCTDIWSNSKISHLTVAVQVIEVPPWRYGIRTVVYIYMSTTQRSSQLVTEFTVAVVYLR